MNVGVGGDGEDTDDPTIAAAVHRAQPSSAKAPITTAEQQWTKRASIDQLAVCATVTLTQSSTQSLAAAAAVAHLRQDVFTFTMAHQQQQQCALCHCANTIDHI